MADEPLKPAAEVVPEVKPEGGAAHVEPAPSPAPAEKAAGLPTDSPTLLEKPPETKPAGDVAKPADAKTEKPDAAGTAAPVVADGKEAKPGEQKADGEVKPEAKPAEPAKPEPIDYKYTVPETLKLDNATKTELHTALDAFRANPAEGVQPLLDLHAKMMQAFVDANAQEISRQQHQVFADTRKEWRNQILADEEIGGNRHDVALKAIARMRDLAVSSAKQGSEKYESDWNEFNKFLRVTGAGDHPAFHRMLHNFARFLDEPTLPPANPKPPKNNGAAPGRRGTVLYDNPRSTPGPN